MDMSQADYEARKQRCNDGVGSDEDRRLCKEYERQGYTVSVTVVDDTVSDGGPPPVNANKEGRVGRVRRTGQPARATKQEPIDPSGGLV